MRQFLICIFACVTAGATYTTTPPRAAKRKAVEKAGGSARGAEAATADPVLKNEVSLRDQDLTRRFDIGVVRDVNSERRRLNQGGECVNDDSTTDIDGDTCSSY